MINKSSLLPALAGVALIGNVLAFSPNDPVSSAATPVPRVITSSVVKPTELPRYFLGAVINVEFSLDQTGQPYDIRVLHVGDPVLTQRLLTAFSQWRFEPGESGPMANRKRFLLPIELRPEA